MIRQARTGDTVLVKSREMREPNTDVIALGGDGLKTMEHKICWPRWCTQLSGKRPGGGGGGELCKYPRQYHNSWWAGDKKHGIG
jgi:hypothetical protein